MTLSVLYNLRYHIPHLRLDNTLQAYWKKWRDSPKGSSYEEMVGLGFDYDRGYKPRFEKYGRTWTFIDDNLQRNSLLGICTMDCQFKLLVQDSNLC